MAGSGQVPAWSAEGRRWGWGPIAEQAVAGCAGWPLAWMPGRGLRQILPRLTEWKVRQVV